MDKKDMNIFEPMSAVETPTFENIDDIIQFGKKQGMVYMDDSMDIPDKIKMLTAIMSGIYFYYVVHVVEYSNLMKALNILTIYLTTIPNNSVEILNAKNEFQAIFSIIYGITMNSQG